MYKGKVKLLEASIGVTRICGKDLMRILSDKLNREIALPNLDDVKRLAEILSVLSNPIRLAIIMLLAQEELPVCLISEILGIDQSLVSHSLRILRNHGLVKHRNIGRYRLYSVKDRAVIEKILEFLREIREEIGHD